MHQRVFVGPKKHSDPRNYSSSHLKSRCRLDSASVGTGLAMVHITTQQLFLLPSPLPQVTAQTVSMLVDVGFILAWKVVTNRSQHFSQALQAVTSRNPARDLPSYKSLYTQKTPVLWLPSRYHDFSQPQSKLAIRGHFYCKQSCLII